MLQLLMTLLVFDGPQISIYRTYKHNSWRWEYRGLVEPYDTAFCPKPRLVFKLSVDTPQMSNFLLLTLSNSESERLDYVQRPLTHSSWYRFPTRQTSRNQWSLQEVFHLPAFPIDPCNCSGIWKCLSGQSQFQDWILRSFVWCCVLDDFYSAVRFVSQSSPPFWSDYNNVITLV